jgi:hypothetical protein
MNRSGDLGSAAPLSKLRPQAPASQMQVGHCEAVAFILEGRSNVLERCALLRELEGSFNNRDVAYRRRHRSFSRSHEAAPAKEGSKGQGRTASSDANAASQTYALRLTSELTARWRSA